jgi:hypothetical protein
MKITKQQLKRIIKEELTIINEYGRSIPTVRDVERMLPDSVIRNTPGVTSVLVRRADAKGWSINQLADKVKSARIKEGEHPRQFFSRMGIRW